MGTALHSRESYFQADKPLRMGRFARPFAISLTLHVIVLSQINLDGLHSRISDQHRLKVSLVPASLPEERSWQVHAGQKHEISQSVNQDDVIRALDANESDYRLDLNQIRNQVREYSRQKFATAGQGLPLYGEYYGTYNGDDGGVFSFHLDNTGQVSGSGESSATGIVFLIAGNISPTGVIHMIAGEATLKASLSGQLNTKDGKISGSWCVSGIAEGLFSGQHE